MEINISAMWLFGIGNKVVAARLGLAFYKLQLHRYLWEEWNEKKKETSEEVSSTSTICGSSLSKAENKTNYDVKLCKLLEDYGQVLIVATDNVGSTQLQNICKGLSGDSTVLMGKNAMMKRSIKIHAAKTSNNAYLSLVPLVGNVGLIFSKGDLKEVREEVAESKVGAPACVGLVAPIDVVVPPGNTGLDPSQTSFFQMVYDNGSVFSPDVLDLTEDDLMIKFASSVSNVTALAMAISYPTIAAAPHMFLNAYKNVLAIAVATEYSFSQADKVKEFLEDPSKFAVAMALLRLQLLRKQRKKSLLKSRTMILDTDMLTASMDTSATTIEWALSELIRQPELMNKVQIELANVVGRERMVEESDLEKLGVPGHGETSNEIICCNTAKIIQRTRVISPFTHLCPAPPGVSPAISPFNFRVRGAPGCAEYALVIQLNLGVKGYIFSFVFYCVKGFVSRFAEYLLPL
ncbi:hypothetical protein ACLB2K_073841 [Fragaria x ananassa]